MKKGIVSLIGILLLVNCFTSQNAKRYFQLQLPGEFTANLKKINKVLLIEAVGAEDLYDDFRVIYRKSPYQINYYAYDFWVKKPGELIGTALVHFFSDSGLFNRVIDKLSDTEPDLILKSRLFSIEEVDSNNKWYARLSLELDFRDFKSGESLFLYRFDKKKVLPKRDVTLLPRMISEILKEELDSLVQPLSQKVE
ncbi:MAG: membrane integrity-associated transporter subunit PqiC [Candidatus Aminicenantes bacterium]|nr:membrane integrity-associated transporter subunit PqiC [Candidatus Aminicenantes bacterium]